jgi:hypothetical protein
MFVGEELGHNKRADGRTDGHTGRQIDGRTGGGGVSI